VTVSTEDQVYADQNVLISTTRIIVNGVTYPLSNVSSVRLYSRSPNYLFPILAVIVGLFALAGGKDTILFALLCLGIGGALFFVLKPTYTMLLGSAGGEKAALTSKDHAYMANVIEHINNAIVARG
jgi:hypothetical protein